MKIKLIGYQTLRRTLELEGDEIVEEGEELLLDENMEGPIPRMILKPLGFNFNNGKEFYSLTKRYNKAWINQTLITFPLPTLMDSDLGYVEESGRVGRYIPETPMQTLFESLTPFLEEMKYNGFITMSFDKEGLINVSFGAGLALYNILEGVKERLSIFFKKGSDVKESWTASIVLSKYPYPFIEKQKRTFIKLSPAQEKHLWFFDLQGFRSGFYTDNTKICIVSAWATMLSVVAERVYYTAQGLDIPMKQYRTDIDEYIVDRWTSYISSVKMTTPML